MNRISLILVLVLALVAGCVVAPVPLIESVRRSMWDGDDGMGGKLSIVQEQRTWYLPILASPEGSAKMRRQKSVCHYFIGTDVSTDEKKSWLKHDDLPWLTIEEDPSFYTWHKILRLEGTECWAAFRRASSDGRGGRGGTFEIAVFDQKKLRSKKLIASRDWTAVQVSDHEYLAGLGYDHDQQSILYDSPEGPKRYRFLEGTEETPNKTVEPTATIPPPSTTSLAPLAHF